VKEERCLEEAGSELRIAGGGTPWTPDPSVGGPEGEVVAAARSLWIIVRKHTGGPP